MISRLKRVGSVLKIEIDGRIYEPLAFKSFRPTEENISDFARCGVKLFSILSTGRLCAYGIPYSLYGESWLGRGVYDFSGIDEQIELFIRSAPDCYFALMIQLDTRDWWLSSHEDYPDSYRMLSQMAADEEWREAAAEYLQAVITHVEKKYGEKMYGYFMLCGHTTEWLSDYDYQRTHPIKERYLREYTGDPSFVIPDTEMPSDKAFYGEERVKLYQRAHAELITDTILFFAKKAQEILGHRKLLGLYYGYLLELKGERLWNAGHLDYARVFESPDIDIISSPASYDFRATDSTSAFMLAHKGLDFHDKLYYLEFDQRTYRTKSFLEGVNIPPAGYACKDDAEAVDLMRRDFMLCTSKGAALWWFDMWNGWYSSPAMLDGIKGIVDTAKRVTELKINSVAEIAVIVSGKALYGVNKRAGVNTALLSEQRLGLLKMGAPYDMYSASDLANIDCDKYKLFIFPTAFETTPEEDAVIKRLEEGGKTILWLYAPRYLNGGITEVERTVGMSVSEAEEAPIFEGSEGTVLPAPYLYINDSDAMPMLRFADGRVAMAVKGKTVYSVLGNLDAATMREVARLADVHLYCETAPVYVSDKLIGIYTSEATTVRVKRDGELTDLFSGRRYVAKGGVIDIPAQENASRLLLYLD